MVVGLRRISVHDYHQMAETEILAPDERTELIDGQIFQMVAKGTAHSAAVSRLSALLIHSLGNQALIRFQDPIQLDDFSEPEPDIAIVQLDPLFYEEHHPVPPDVHLLIEVSDTTLKHDLEVKARAYAQALIKEYWILDVQNRQVFVFRHSDSQAFLEQAIATEEEVIAPLDFPSCSFAVKEMLRPQSKTR